MTNYKCIILSFAIDCCNRSNSSTYKSRQVQRYFRTKLRIAMTIEIFLQWYGAGFKEKHAERNGCGGLMKKSWYTLSWSFVTNLLMQFDISIARCNYMHGNWSDSQIFIFQFFCIPCDCHHLSAWTPMMHWSFFFSVTVNSYFVSGCDHFDVRASKDLK